jgi:hypothetical protein
MFLKQKSKSAQRPRKRFFCVLACFSLRFKTGKPS